MSYSMTAFIFNQYYIDFLKRLKEVAKTKCDEKDDAKRVLRTIKDKYKTLDKSSDEYISFVNASISNETWELFLTDDSWLSNNGSLQIYQDITIDDATAVLGDDYLCKHFMSVFYIFRKDLTEDTVAKIVSILQTTNTTQQIAELEDESIRTVLGRLNSTRNEKIKEKSGIDMKFIEDTSLGRLAKEILEDIDVAKLQKSMGENGDVLKAIGDPDSGFADVISSVSKKMANKISSGDLKQENLIQDAMKFASMMPGMFGGGGGKKGGAQDMSGLMSMMSAMMSESGAGADDFSKMFQGATPPPAKKGTRTAFNDSAIKKMAKAKKLKKKLRENRLKAEQAEQAEQAKQEAQASADTVVEK